MNETQSKALGAIIAECDLRAKEDQFSTPEEALHKVRILLEPIDLTRSRFAPEFKNNISRARVILDRAVAGTQPPIDNRFVKPGCEQFQ